MAFGAVLETVIGAQQLRQTREQQARRTLAGRNTACSPGDRAATAWNIMNSYLDRTTIIGSRELPPSAGRRRTRAARRPPRDRTCRQRAGLSTFETDHRRIPAMLRRLGRHAFGSLDAASADWANR